MVDEDTENAVCLFAHRNYIAIAKNYQPYISPHLTENIAARYAKMREEAEKVRCADDGRLRDTERDSDTLTGGAVCGGRSRPSLVVSLTGQAAGPHDGANASCDASPGVRACSPSVQQRR